MSFKLGNRAGVWFIIWCFFTLVACLGRLKEFDAVPMHEIIGTDVFFEITEPAELSYTYKIRPAQDFGTTFNESFAVKNIPMVLVEPPSACGKILNHDELRGNVAFVERGDCSFLTKTVQVEKYGAIAIIVSDYDNDNDALYIEMVDDNTLREVHIPAGFILGKNGYVIKKTLHKLNRKYALINLPVNLSTVAIHKMNQPPWLGW